jgi:hypothetical protein
VRLIGPTGAREPVLETIHVTLGNIDPERTDVGVGAVRTDHATSPLSSPASGPEVAVRVPV